MDKMREEFEAWFWNEFHKNSDVAFYWDSVFSINGNGEYCGVACNAYWTVWQVAWKASRAALCVELSEMTNNGYEGFYPRRVVIQALDSAGVRYK